MTARRVPWWMYVFAASTIAAFVVNAWTNVMRPEGPGFTRAGRFSLAIAEIAPGGPFDRAGIRAGDLLRAVDGRRLDTILDWALVRTTLDVGKPFEVEVLRGSETLRMIATLERRRGWVWETPPPPSWQIYLSLAAVQSAALASVALALLILFKRPEDPVARLAAWLLASTAIAPGTPIGQFSTLAHLPVPLALLVVVGLAGSMGQPTAWFAFFATFPRRLLTKRWHVALAALPGALMQLYFLVWFVGPLYVPQLRAPAPWRLFAMALGLTFAANIGGLALLVRNCVRAQDLNERRRLQIVLAGTMMGLLGVALAGFPFHIVGQNVALATLLSVWGVVLSIALPSAFAYAILRHRLFDLGFIVRQGLQYALARGVVGAALPAAAAILFADVVLHRDETIGAILAARGWLYATVGALALVALRQRDRWLQAIDRRFFRERYNAQQILRDVAAQVRRAESIDLAGTHVVSRVEAALHPEFVALLVREPHESAYGTIASAPAGAAQPVIAADTKTIGLLRLLDKPLTTTASASGWLRELPVSESDALRRARIDLLVPVSLAAGGREAVIALGQKKSEEPYSSEDQELLVAIASNLAMLVERAGAPAAPPTMPRMLAGRYRLDGQLGRGGMGTVYRAHDTVLDRAVALKMIRDDLVASPEVLERFRREARAAAAITHPHLVTLYDFAVDEGRRAFLVMELLNGCALRHRLREAKRLGPAVALEVVRAVCSAMTAAHQRGLVHRDLKPENIFLARDGTGETVKVLDFGLAKFLGSYEAETHATFETGDGALLGTTAYMSPEQLTGKPVSPLWDLWALAVVIYEMLTSAHPYGRHDSVLALQNAIVSGAAVPVAAAMPEAPQAWQPLFDAALHPDAARRPQSAAALLDACERALAGDLA